ncbi:VOC family protein [Streptomyces sp. NPDC050264]|uniref:VOC family protein n=1 Tax=Streptomyces sp. NPDC050264 TaxID=3155038 RepID=UPI00344A7462
MRINCLILDAADPERLAAFWSEVLGRPSWTAPGRTSGSGARTVWGIEGLGGRRLHECADGGFLVMADPEGNGFCVIPEGPVGLDDEGRAHYLG